MKEYEQSSKLFFWFTLLFRHNGSRIVGNNHSDNIHHASSLAIYAGMIFRYDAFLNRLSSLSPLSPSRQKQGEKRPDRETLTAAQRQQTRQRPWQQKRDKRPDRDLDIRTETRDQSETLTAARRQETSQRPWQQHGDKKPDRNLECSRETRGQTYP